MEDFEYNGIKFFNQDGYKLDDEVEKNIEEYIDDIDKTIEMLNNNFRNSFEVKDVRNLIKTGNREDIVFINKEFIVPYLEFVKRNKRTLREKFGTIFVAN